MRAPDELAAVRRQILERRAASDAAEERREFLRRGQVGRQLEVRCEREHRRGSRPKLAEAVEVGPQQLLFLSRIRWAPRDQLKLPGWMREHFLGPGANNELLTDDGLLSRYLDHLDEQGSGVSATGPRWLKKMPDFELLVIVEPASEPAITPWVRCHVHLGDARAVQREELFAALR